MPTTAFAVAFPDGSIDWNSFASSIVGATAKVSTNASWHILAREGYKVVEFTAAAQATPVPLVNVQWDLYEEDPLAAEAEQDLTAHLSALLDESRKRGFPDADRAVIEAAMEPHMQKWANQGACDGTTYRILRSVLVNHFERDWAPYAAPALLPERSAPQTKEDAAKESRRTHHELEFRKAVSGIPANHLSAVMDIVTPGARWARCTKEYMAKRYAMVQVGERSSMYHGDDDAMRVLNLEKLREAAEARRDGNHNWASLYAPKA